MTKKPQRSTKVTGLRRQAEARLRMTKRDVAAMPVKDVQQLVHELQVHQIELEMQNNKLRLAQMELGAACDRYVELYDCAPTGYLTLDLKGMILEANLPACTVLGVNRKELRGQPVIRFVVAKDQATFLRHIREVFKARTRQACEVGLTQQDDAPVSVRFESVVVLGEAEQYSRVLTALQDITERIRAAAAFQACWQGLVRQRNLEERVRIGHNLHDGVFQSLYAVGLGLETSKLDLLRAPDKVSALLAQSIDELNSVMRDVRSVIGELEAKVLPETDLPASLPTMAGILAHLHGRHVRVSVDRAITTGMSPAQSFEILKLAKEALSNSFRHARATQVQVSFRQVKDGTRLTVWDNGRGFHRKGATGDGRGVVSMAARARRLGGILSVQSMRKQGTRVALNLPNRHSMADIKMAERDECGSGVG